MLEQFFERLSCGRQFREVCHIDLVSRIARGFVSKA